MCAVSIYSGDEHQNDTVAADRTERGLCFSVLNSELAHPALAELCSAGRAWTPVLHGRRSRVPTTGTNAGCSDLPPSASSRHYFSQLPSHYRSWHLRGGRCPCRDQ